MRRSRPPHRLTVEFVGLPGSGKTSVARRVRLLVARTTSGCSMVEDFIAWSANRSKLYKLALVLKAPLRSVRYFARGVRFWLSLDRRSAGSLLRSLQAPVIALSLERFLETEAAPLVLLDQADVQGVWSIGALTNCYDSAALETLLASATEGAPRAYVCITPDAQSAAQNIANRDGGGSRFDGMTERETENALRVSVPLMTEIVRVIKSKQAIVLLLKPDTDLETKVALVAELVQRHLKWADVSV